MQSDSEIATLQKELRDLKRDHAVATQQLKEVERIYLVMAEKFEVLKEKIKSIDLASGEA